jgi:hypothetical protein
MGLRKCLAEQHAQLRVRPGDVRDVALRNSAESVAKHIFMLGVIARAWADERIQSLFAAVNIPSHDQFRFVQSAINGCDRALITDLHFQLEHMTCSLARRLLKVDSRSLVPAADVLIRSLHPLITAGGVARLLRPFKVASAIRNCLHNNGVHANKSFQAKVGKYRYTFVRHRVVFYELMSFLTVCQSAWNECAYWFSTRELQRLRVMDKFATDIGLKLLEYMQHVSTTSAEMEQLFARPATSDENRRRRTRSE